MMATAADLARRLKAKRGGSGWVACCPAHDDNNPSLSIGESKDGQLLLHCHAGCTFEAIMMAANIEPAKPNGCDRSAHKRIVATYDYVDERGELVFQTVRYAPKDFRQRRPDGNGGSAWNLKGVELVPYNLPQVLDANEVYICEGEKDADSVAKLGLTATTSPLGAGKWPKAFAGWFDGRHVVIIPHNDQPGRDHAADVAATLQGTAASIRILALPGLAEKGDASDWIAKGGTAEQLLELAANAPQAATFDQVCGETKPSEPIGADTRSDDWEAPATSGLTEDDLAASFTRRHQHELRYVALWGAWMHWTGTRWDREPTLMTFDLARAVCRDAANGLDNAKLRARILSAGTRAAVENMARADRAHAATTDQWDRDPFAVTGQNVTVNLRSGQTRKPDPLDYITKLAGIAPAPPGTLAPRWQAFLHRVTDGNPDLQEYLQRMAGYCLTGDVSAHTLFFLYGTGANGKSVFINTLVDLMGDYALTIGSDMLMVSFGDRHPTEVARLRGVRLAVANEIEVGKTWAESKIKALTGGDRLQARYMRQDFFEFDPQFKLVIVGNHKPSLRGVDEAIRRRLHLIPFTVTIPPAERDSALPAKLKAEAPAILRWAIDGCLAWQRDGLRPPSAVTAATEDYLAGEDTFELWRDACTTSHPDAWESSAELWASWKKWAEQAGEFVGSQKAFSQILAERGLVPHQQAGTRTRGFRGARLNRPDYTEDRRYGS